jgi:hypothetical protein
MFFLNLGLIFVGITGVTCEANTMLMLASEIKKVCGAIVVVGGMHASNDPDFFNQRDIDYIIIGLITVKKSFCGLRVSAPGSPKKWIKKAY